MGNVSIVRRSRTRHSNRIAAAAQMLGAGLPAGIARPGVDRARAARVRKRGAGERPRSDQIPAPRVRHAADGGGGAHRQRRTRIRQDGRHIGRWHAQLLPQTRLRTRGALHDETSVNCSIHDCCSGYNTSMFSFFPMKD